MLSPIQLQHMQVLFVSFFQIHSTKFIRVCEGEREACIGGGVGGRALREDRDSKGH